MEIKKILHICTSKKNELHGTSGCPLLIQSRGVSYGHTRGSPICINRTAANGGLTGFVTDAYGSKEKTVTPMHAYPYQNFTSTADIMQAIADKLIRLEVVDYITDSTICEVMKKTR